MALRNCDRVSFSLVHLFVFSRSLSPSPEASSFRRPPVSPSVCCASYRLLDMKVTDSIEAAIVTANLIWPILSKIHPIAPGNLCPLTRAGGSGEGAGRKDREGEGARGEEEPPPIQSNLMPLAAAIDRKSRARQRREGERRKERRFGGGRPPSAQSIYSTRLKGRD